MGDPSKIPKTGAVNGRIKPRTGIVCVERVVCAWNGWCFAENGLLGFPVCHMAYGDSVYNTLRHS